MKLEAIDTKQVLTLSPTASVSKAFNLMVDRNIRHLPIIEEAKTVGIISDRDLLIVVHWISTWKSLTNVHTLVAKKPVSEMMTSPVSVLSPNDTVQQAARMMLEGRFSAVPLEHDGKLVSIVTETDVLQCFLDDSVTGATTSWRDLPVAEHMAKVLITAKPTDHVMPSFRVMKENDIRHMPVVADGNLVGLISDRDLRRSYGREIAVNLAKTSSEPEGTYHSTLEDFMSREVDTIDHQATLADAAGRMVQRKIGALPVLDGQSLVGIITETDLLRVLVRHCKD